jgi:S1-C subfamily serine protease
MTVTRPRRRIGIGGVLCAIPLVLALVGCAGWTHGYTTLQFQGQVLRVPAGGPGAARLRIESDYDTTVRNFVVQYGEPDYLFLPDRFTLYLIYLDTNRVAAFTRSTFNSHSRLSLEEVPPAMIQYLSPSERQRLEHARASSIVSQGLPSAPQTLESLPAVVRIETPTTVGSGFFVTADYIATNAHVLSGAHTARVSSGQDVGVTTLVIYVNPSLDFAVLKSPVKGQPLPIRTGPITDGEPVTAVGFPQGRRVVASSTGTVRGLNEFAIIHDALIAGGSSGGPLLGADGRVLGVNTALAKNRGDRANVTDRALAIKMSTVLSSLGSR